MYVKAMFSNFSKASFSPLEFQLSLLSSCFDFMSTQHGADKVTTNKEPQRLHVRASGRSCWHHRRRLFSSPSADACRWSQTPTPCSVQTGWSTSQHPPSTARSAPRRPQTPRCSEPAASGSSRSACRGWWSGWLFVCVLSSLLCLLNSSRCRNLNIYIYIYIFSLQIICRFDESRIRLRKLETVPLKNLQTAP